LLAYLDNTLEPDDVEVLRQKLEESGFATQLVQRIRDSLTNKELTAPAPDSAHPIGEANVISEYLDSTLTAEQISEIERACLESEPHLAEAAACHQILTMVLGKPAEVSDALRRRIHSLPESQGRKPTVSGSFSSVSIPPDDTNKPLAGAAAGQSASPDAGKPVQPVGLVDSGVFDAPSRIRESGAAGQAAPSGDAATSGAHLKVSDVYDEKVRRWRLTPWLVPLGLAGLLVFALIQIFAPLLSDTTAQKDAAEERIKLNPDDTDLLPEIEAPLSETPVLKSVGTPDVDASDAAEPDAAAADDDRVLPPPSQEATEAAPLTAVETIAEAAPAANDAADVAKPPGPAGEAQPPAVDGPPAAAVQPDAAGKQAAAVDGQPIAVEGQPTPAPAANPNPSVDTAKADSAMTSETAADSLTIPAPAPGEVAAAPGKAPPPPVDPAAANAADPAAVPVAVPADQAAQGVAKAASPKTLLISRIADDEWIRIATGTMIGEGVPLVNAPGFRSDMVTNAGDVVTLINSSGASWIPDPEGGDTAALHILFGRALITAKQANATLSLVLGDRPAKITMAEPDSVLGVEVQYFRQPGADPRDPAHRTRVARLFSVQGNMRLQSGTIDETLAADQQWLLKGDQAAPIAALPAMPAWVKSPDPDDRSIETEARAGLLELVDVDQPLTLALREATAFRRSEVGALAAQTLLLLGNGSVYFGSDGMLNNPKQRTFWPAHFRALRSFVDLNAESAESLWTAITEMDAADGKTLFRLLVGFSSKQLIEGGDEELVNMLESGSMAVRVMAIENLREITGTTLYYRPEEENAARRAQVVKKWRTLQRKQEIKWGGEE
jgi:hypothetical protein